MILKDINEMFADDLRDPSYAAGYLNIALEDDGIEGFLYALQKVARAHGISKVALSSDTSRESLYRALSDKGNPSVKTLTRVLSSLGLSLTVTSSIQESCVTDKEQATEPAKLGPQVTEQYTSMEMDATAMRIHMEKEFAALRQQAWENQKEAQKATLEIQEESRRVLLQMQQFATAIAEQMHITPGSNRRTDNNPSGRATAYSFPTQAGNQAPIKTQLYQENPLKLVEVAA